MVTFYTPVGFTKAQAKELQAWKKKNPGKTATDYKVELGLIDPATIKDPNTPKPSASQFKSVKTLKLPTRFKSTALKNFENVALANSGDPNWNLYRRAEGRWKWTRTIDTCKREEIAEEFGGGRWKIVQVDPNTDMEVIGDMACTIIDIDEKEWPSKYPETGRRGFGPIIDVPTDEDSFTAEDVKEATDKALKDAALQNSINMLLASKGEAPKDDFVAMLEKVATVQKVILPPPTIGEAKAPGADMVATLTGLGTAAAALMQVWAQVKTMLPKAPEPVPQSNSLGDTLMASLAPKLIDKLMASPEAGSPARKVIDASPTQEDTAMFESMASELKAQISLLQKKETDTNSDTVGEMVEWLKAKTGMAWNMLKGKMAKAEPAEIVDFVASMDASLTDSEFKRDWIANVCQVLKAPAPPAPPASRPPAPSDKVTA